MAHHREKQPLDCVALLHWVLFPW